MKLIKLFLLGCLCLLSFEIQAQVDKILSSDSLLFRAHLVYQNNPDQAFTYSKRAIERAKLENSELNLGKAYDMLGVSLDYLGELDSALFYFEIGRAHV